MHAWMGYCNNAKHALTPRMYSMAGAWKGSTITARHRWKSKPSRMIRPVLGSRRRWNAQKSLAAKRMMSGASSKLAATALTRKGILRRTWTRCWQQETVATTGFKSIASLMKFIGVPSSLENSVRKTPMWSLRKWLQHLKENVGGKQNTYNSRKESRQKYKKLKLRLDRLIVYKRHHERRKET